MRSMPVLLATIAVAAAAAGWLGPGPVFAGHDSKNCGIVSKGASDYRVHASYLKCKVARRGATKYLRSAEARRGYDCAPTQGGSFYCQNDATPPQAYWAIRL